MSDRALGDTADARFATEVVLIHPTTKQPYAAAGGGGTADSTAANQLLQITQETAAAASLSTLDDWDESDRAKVNIIAGQAGVAAGAGTVDATVQRVTLASDGPGVAALGGVADVSVSSPASSGSIIALSKGNLTLLGALTETAPATDTASSGLNGRLQRIAQKITSLIALIPTALSPSGFLKTALDGVDDAQAFSVSVTSATTIVTWTMTGFNYVSWDFPAVGVGCTVVLEQSNNGGASYKSAPSFETQSVGGSGASSISLSTNGSYMAGAVAPLMRLRVSVYGSATVTVSGVLKRGPMPDIDRACRVIAASGAGLEINAPTSDPLFIAANSSLAGAAITPVTTTVAADSKVLKASPGNFYGGGGATGGTAGWVMLFDAVAKPADGAVQPVRAWAVGANSSVEVNFLPALRLATGGVLVFSSTGPYTLTASATALLSGEMV